MKNSPTRSQFERHTRAPEGSDVSGNYDAFDSTEAPDCTEADPRVAQLARRAVRLRREGDFRKAANVYGELTSVQPRCSRWWVLLAAAFASCGRADEARKTLRQALYLLRQGGPACAPRVHSVQTLDTRIAQGDFSLNAPRSRGLARRRALLRAA